MNKPTFKEGLLVALILSFLGTVIFFVIDTLFLVTNQFYLTSSILSACYLLYLMIRSQTKLGRFTAFLLWFVVTASSWFAAIPLSLFILVQLGIIWMIRSLYFYSSLFSAASDLFLTGISIAAALWAGFHSGTLFLALWSFFLIQSLFIFIPSSLKTLSFKDSTVESLIIETPDDEFNRAHHSAKQALAKLAE